MARSLHFHLALCESDQGREQLDALAHRYCLLPPVRKRNPSVEDQEIKMKSKTLIGALVMAMMFVLTSQSAQARDAKSQLPQLRADLPALAAPFAATNVSTETVLNTPRAATVETTTENLVTTQRWRRPWRRGYYYRPRSFYPYYGYRSYYRYPAYNYGGGGLYWSGPRGGLRIYW